MDYEKKYNEALERASKLRVQNPFDTVSQMMEHVFPELAESEDERIRREIQSAIEQLDKDSTICGKKYDYNQWLAWLEKQSEKNSKEYWLKELGFEQNGYDPVHVLKTMKGKWPMAWEKVLYQEQNPAWSEEDENEVAVLEAYIRSKDWSESHISRALGIVDELVNKVKSLRPQSQWKPSDEQMKSLRWVIEYGNTTQTEILKGIYEQLKKLKE